MSVSEIIFNLEGGKVVLLLQDGVKAVLRAFGDVLVVLHRQGDTRDEGVGACQLRL